MFEGASIRGKDGVGITIIYPYGGNTNIKVLGSYENNKNEILSFVCEGITVGCLLLASFRATPETEPPTNYDMIQPIFASESGLFLVHNGGVTDSVKNSFDFDYQTPLDSEAIIASYLLNGRNMVTAMEELSGSFAFVMLDMKKEKLFAVTSFLPLAHSYIRGYGYFIHSDNRCLGKMVEKLTGSRRDGINVWESWYHHDLEGYSIYETDLQSGFQMRTQFAPRFLHPTWDSLAVPYSHTKTFVVASGGIDSGLTARLLQLAGHDVSMIHFQYGQKSNKAESWAIRKLSEKFNLPYHIIDLSLLYHDLVDPSMLLKEDIKVTSGDDQIKSTIAWCAGRNAIFASIAMAYAETAILNHNYQYVYLAAGWSQLSEETGGYPDNSYKFNCALEELKKYGYITGHRIHFLPVLQNLTKTECWKLGASINFPFKYTVSCDDPIMVNGKPLLCVNCGSTKLSILAADRAGVDDKRLFIDTRPILSEPVALQSPYEIIDRLMLNEADKKQIKEKVYIK